MESLEKGKPSWDEVFLLMSMLLSSRASCNRLLTACILTKDKRIKGAGYNGATAGAPNCDDVGHRIVEGHCIRTIHGEHNAILNSSGDLRDATAYIIGTPCVHCTKYLIQAGIRRFVTVGVYKNVGDRGFIDELLTVAKATIDEKKDPVYLIDSLAKALKRLRGPGGILRDIPLEQWQKLLPECDNAQVKDSSGTCAEC
ncbi:MAG: dCMP deaminase [Parcubacteria group bacterium Gr01-1014_19]|nr:MAG: dCMP deaminase [Parcubacteria group bacterium Gr01-1014_19]